MRKFQKSNLQIFVEKYVKIQIQSALKCIKCAKPLEDTTTTTTTTIRCPNCKSKQRLADVKKIRKALMGIEDTTKTTHNVVLFSEVLETYCNTSNLNEKDDDDLEDYFLELEDISVNVQEHTDIVITIL